MKTFVLIIYLKMGYSGGWLNQEFASKEACEHAYAQLDEQGAVDKGGCYPKR